VTNVTIGSISGRKTILPFWISFPVFTGVEKHLSVNKYNLLHEDKYNLKYILRLFVLLGFVCL
jgi:hypothetical protein